MNNSFLAVERVNLSFDEERPKETLKERETKLIRLIEALAGLIKTKHWSTLKSEVFDGLADGLRKELSYEAKKEHPDVHVLRFVAGQLVWAEKYADLEKWEAMLRKELSAIRLKING